MHTKFKLLLLSVTLLALAARTTIPVMAQNPTGSIRGTVTDQSGAIIQNANVTVTNKATGDVRKVSTGSDGIFAVENLLAGDSHYGQDHHQGDDAQECVGAAAQFLGNHVISTSELRCSSRSGRGTER